ncbi:MAG: pyridine nucleotide-disulfide oxidoreductase [Streptosporangiales bacterium]|nr:pyridine nucleotide-disulfide oxidoreductase [Streptosporangiales bacterium]
MTIVIVGAGQTGAVAARTLRRRGYAERIVLLGAEADGPYQRPPLSKEYLAGTVERAELDLLDPSWCAENAVELRTGCRVVRIRTGDRAVELADGASVVGDVVLLATGGRARRLPGVSGERVHHLRTVADAERLRASLRPGAHVIIAGAGFIGSEVASTAVAAGASVTVLEQAPVPLAHAIGPRMGEVCAGLLREAGVDLRTSERVASVTERSGGVEVRTAAGTVLAGDALVVGIGMLPNDEVAAASRLDVSDGVLVDEHCRTSAPGVFAAGDVARHYHPPSGRHVRVEHVDNATAQGMAAAKNMLGKAVPYDAPHWFYSEQFGHDLQFAGDAEGCDELVSRGDPASRDFVAFYLRKGVVRAAFAIDRGGDVALARALITAQAAPEPAALADESVDLADLLD